jgi:hypothetical protein
VKRSAEPINIGWPAKAKLSCVLNGSNPVILGRDADARSWHERRTFARPPMQISPALTPEMTTR